MKYDYYLQEESGELPSLRRYAEGEEKGHRWNRKTQEWDEHCCERRDCHLTKDRIISEKEAKQYQ